MEYLLTEQHYLKLVQKLQLFCSASFLARDLLCPRCLLVDEHFSCATSDGTMCESTVGKSVALLLVAFVVE